jgi:hypothetical protein
MGVRNMKTKTIISYIIIAVLYAWTWYGGYHIHSKDLASEANETYSSIVKEHQKKKEEYDSVGLEYSYDIYTEVYKNGPKIGINWCFPIIPGIFIADSYYSIGPSSSVGGRKVILFYGIGAIEL